MQMQKSPGFSGAFAYQRRVAQPFQIISGAISAQDAARMAAPAGKPRNATPAILSDRGGTRAAYMPALAIT